MAIQKFAESSLFSQAPGGGMGRMCDAGPMATPAAIMRNRRTGTARRPACQRRSRTQSGTNSGGIETASNA